MKKKKQLQNTQGYIIYKKQIKISNNTADPTTQNLDEIQHKYL